MAKKIKGTDRGTSGAAQGDQLLAAIDVGTNSFHLVIVRVLPDGSFVVVNKEKIGVRLGESPKQIKHLSDEAIDRGVEAMTLFAHLVERAGARVRAVATSAVREAENGEEFIDRVRERTGIEVEVVSGFEEARLIYLGVMQALPVVDRRIALFDIGGGSTEILVGERGSPLYANSFKIGAIRMTQRFLPEERITQEQVDRLRLYIRGELYFAAREVRSREPEMLIASSGTAQTIASMVLTAAGDTIPEQLNGLEIGLEQIRPILRQVIDAPSHAKRAALPGGDPRRADILAAGGIVLQTVMEELGFDRFTVSSYALREGIILDTIRKESDARAGTPSHLADQRFDSVLKLGRTFNFDEEHGRHVARLALKLYDELEGVHALGKDSRELLEAAALLHDIGYYISHAAHHKHALYLIRHSGMLGFNREEIDVIANVARYHRKSHPKSSHEDYALLSKADRARIPVLAGILRIADGLDRTHRSNVRDLQVVQARDRIEIQAVADENADTTFEIWSASRKKGLLALALGRKVTLLEVPTQIDTVI